MNKRFIGVIAVVALSLGALITVAVESSAKQVLTVAELVSEAKPRSRVRLGARVTEAEIQYQTAPSFLLQFVVHDIPTGEETVPVRYKGVMPDTLKAGRDVILEGEFDGATFLADSLLTQCPSKYEPPLPGGA